MKLAQIILSYPIRTFHTMITHSTPRRSTAIEWAVLEAIATAQRYPEIQSLTIGELFSKVLKVSDVNGLLKSHIANLMDVEALVQDNAIINEHADLFKIGMKQLKVTENGTTMQSKGLLPGEIRTDSQKFDLNIFTGDVTLTEESDDQENIAGGISVCDDETISNTPLPSLKISQLLRQEAINKKSEITWLTPSSDIQEIHEAPEIPSKKSRKKITWQNKAHIINISGNGNLTAKGMDDALISKTVDLLETNSNMGTLNSSRITKRDNVNFDKDVDRIVLENEIPAVLHTLKQNNRIFIKNKDLYSAAVNLGQSKEPNVLINYGSQEFNCRYDEKSKLLNVDVPADHKYDDLFNSTLFVSGHTPLKVNTFDISIGESTRELTLPYVPKNSNFPLSEFISPMVQSYASQNHEVLNLFLMNHQYDLFNKMVQEISDEQEGISPKARFFTQLRDSNKRFFGRSFLTPENESNILFRNWIQEKLSTEQAFQRVQELTSETFIRNNPEIMMGGFAKLLEHWSDRENIELFWKIIAAINRGSKMEAFISGKDILKQLYTDRILEQMIAQFGSIPTDIKKTDRSEEILLDMQKAFTKIKARINSMGFHPDLSSQEKHTIAYNNPKGLQELDTMLSDMRQLYSKLADYIHKRHGENFSIQDIGYFLKDEFQEFNDMVKLLENISRWIRPYLGADYSGFKNIYVADTCAIMHEPKLVQKFEQGNSALVIPKKVIVELDGLKESSNEATKKAARDAIRALNSCHGKKWFFEEGADTSLLPIEYTMDSSGQIGADNLILAVAMKFWSRNPILLVDDKNFSNKAFGEKIQYLTVAKFMQKSDKQV